MSNQVHAPAAFFLRKQPPVPLNSRLGAAYGKVAFYGTRSLISTNTGFDRIRRCDYSLLPLGGNIYISLLWTEHQEKEVKFTPEQATNA